MHYRKKPWTLPASYRHRFALLDGWVLNRHITDDYIDVEIHISNEIVEFLNSLEPRGIKGLERPYIFDFHRADLTVDNFDTLFIDFARESDATMFKLTFHNVDFQLRNTTFMATARREKKGSPK